MTVSLALRSDHRRGCLPKLSPPRTHTHTTTTTTTTTTKKEALGVLARHDSALAQLREMSQRKTMAESSSVAVAFRHGYRQADGVQRITDHKSVARRW